MFLDAFLRPAEEPQESFAKPAAGESKAPAPGEFTQIFGALNPAGPAPAPREEAARISERKAVPPASPANPPRMKGFSSPGASDSASDEGSFTQVFRTISASPAPTPQIRPIQPLTPQASSLPPAVEKGGWPSSPAKSPGATDLFRALSAADRPPVDRNPHPSPEPGSVTDWMRKLSEEEPAVKPQPATPAPVATVSGEYTRIIAGEAPAKVQVPVMEAPKVAPPQVAAPAVAAPRTKLQEMLPILLVLNSFLLVVLILLVVFVLLRK